MSERQTTYRASEERRRRDGLRGRHAVVTVRWEPGGRATDDCGQRLVDELLTAGTRLELMDEANAWADVCGLRLWFRAAIEDGQPVLFLTAEPDDCAEVEG